MLTAADIVDYIKRSISFLPYIDISDEDILDQVKRYTLRDFSIYSRLKKTTIVDTNNDWFKTTEPNVFKFYCHESSPAFIFLYLLRFYHTQGIYEKISANYCHRTSFKLPVR